MRASPLRLALALCLSARSALADVTHVFTRGETFASIAERYYGNPAPAALAHHPRLVEFVSRECTVCRRMAPVVAAAERVCSHGPAVQRIDVGTPDGRDLARRYGIVGVPTFLSLDANHEERRRLIGEQPQDRLIEALEALSGSRCTSAAESDAAVACAADGSTTGGC